MIKVYSRRKLMLEMRKPYDAEIEYLESTGTQWINTLYSSINQNTNIEAKFVNLSTTGKCLFGTRKAFVENNLSFWINADANNRVRAIKGTYLHPGDYDRVITTLNLSSIVNINGRNVSLTTNGQTTNWNLPSNNFSWDKPLFVFNCNNNGSPNDSWGAEVKLYYLKIYNESTLAMDFIPVRVGDVGYLFDKVSMKLFGNSGTGSFILGPDK